MSVDLSAGYELGTLGNTLNSADAGNATPYDFISKDAQNTLAYDNAHTIEGSKSCKHVIGVGGHDDTWAWRDTGALGSARTELYGRGYWYFTAVPPTNGASLHWAYDTNTVRAWAIVFQPGGHVTLVSQGGGSIDSTNLVPLNQFCRIEYHVVSSDTVGSIEAKLFFGADPHSTTPTETFSLTAQDTGPNISWLWTGSLEGNDGWTYWEDAIGVNYTAYPGPVSVPTSQFSRPSADAAAGGWTPTPGSPTTLFDKLDETSADDADYISATAL